MSVTNLLFGGGYPLGVFLNSGIYPTCFIERICCFVLFLFNFTRQFVYADHLVSISFLNHNYLNSTTIFSCLCFYSLYCDFINLILFVIITICTYAINFICT